jgi:hypothetical protein
VRPRLALAVDINGERGRRPTGALPVIEIDLG